MKTDARVRYTKMMIQKVFLELLREKPLKRITVSEICNKAEINRATFYKHYLDVYDLKDRLQDQAMEKFLTLITTLKEGGSARNVLISILSSFPDNELLRSLTFFRSSDDGFAARVGAECFRLFASDLPSSGTDGSHQLRSMRYCYISAGSAGIIHYWVRNGMKEPPEVIADLILQMNRAALG